MNIGCPKYTCGYDERQARSSILDIRLILNDKIEIQYEKGVYVAKCINEGRCKGGDASKPFASFL